MFSLQAFSPLRKRKTTAYSSNLGMMEISRIYTPLFYLIQEKSYPIPQLVLGQLALCFYFSLLRLYCYRPVGKISLIEGS